MTALGYHLSRREAAALRECAKATVMPYAYVPLSTFLDEVTPRVFLGRAEDTDPPFKFIAKIGKDDHSARGKIEREKLGLLPQVYFRFGPRCRACGQRVRDEERVLGFRFAPDRREDRTRVAYLHAEPCGGGYVVETPFHEAYAIEATYEEAEKRLREGREYLNGAATCGHPLSPAYVAERSLRIRAISPEERERILEEGTPVLDREP